MYPVGDERDASRGLYDLWTSLRGDRSIYRNWPMWGKFAALWKPSIYCTAPLQKLVHTKLDRDLVRKSGKSLHVGAVSLKTGEYQSWNELSDDLCAGVLASSSFPVAFEPILARGELWTDGGLRNVTPLKAAILLGATKVDVVIPSPSNPAMKDAKKWNTIDIALRSLSIMMDEVMDNDLEICERTNELADGERWRHVDVRVIRPKEDLGNSLDFSPVRMVKLIAQGYEDAERAEEK